jgi:hypothetical protein
MPTIPGETISALVIVAVNCVELRNPVANGELFHRTTAPGEKPPPESVTVTAGPPANVELGLSKEILGVALPTEKTTSDDVPPSGLTTLMPAVPGETISALVTVAVNCVELRNPVANGELFHRTTAPGEKPLPESVTVTAGPPANVELGLSKEILGVALPTEKTTSDDVPPSGLTTLMPTVLGETISALVTVAVNCVELRNPVANGELFHRTTAPGEKPLPESVTVTAGSPANAQFGRSREILGLALPTEKTTGDDVPPSGLTTLMPAVPGETISALVTVAVNCVELRNPVANGELFHCTTAPGEKPLPESVTVTAGPPANVEVGFSKEIYSSGPEIFNV